MSTSVSSNDEPDPDSLTHQARIALEEEAIKAILAADSSLQRTKTNNPGFDLVAVDTRGSPIRWVEVKSMTGSIPDGNGE